MTKTKVDIRKLKNFAFTQLSKPSVLREILLSEEDELDVHVFVARSLVWLRLSRFSISEGSKR